MRNAPYVRELWHVIDPLTEIGEAKDYGRRTELLAINLTEIMLAALRGGAALPSKARINRLLALSRTPQYRGQIRIAYGDREILCLAFDRPGGHRFSPGAHQSASRVPSLESATTPRKS